MLKQRWNALLVLKCEWCWLLWALSLLGKSTTHFLQSLRGLWGQCRKCWLVAGGYAKRNQPVMSKEIKCSLAKEKKNLFFHIANLHSHTNFCGNIQQSKWSQLILLITDHFIDTCFLTPPSPSPPNACHSSLIKIYDESQTYAGVSWRGGGGNIYHEQTLCFFDKRQMFHSNAAFRILETVMNSCAPLCLVHNVRPRHWNTPGFPHKIKFNVTPSSRMVHKSSIWFAWTVATSSFLDKYKPNSEYYVRDRNKAI